MASSRDSAARSASTVSPGSDSSQVITMPVRSRKWAPKVKTGCMTCRIRRVKCDETKPECKRCSSAGRQCLGQTYGWSRNQASKKPLLRPKPDNNTLALASQPGYTVSPSEVSSSQEEMTMFHFFRTEAASHLAGAFDQRFCTLDLLQASKLHPAVWHGCTALAAMYQRESILCKETSESEQQRFYVLALRQYDASIKSIVKLIKDSPEDKTSQEILLISCLLFTAICCLQGNLKTALVHLRNGRKLFHEWKHKGHGKQALHHFDNNNNGLISAKVLIALLSRLCTQAIELRESPWEEWDSSEVIELSPHPFKSPVDAYLEFEPICNGFLELRHRKRSALHYGHVGPAQELRRAYQNTLAAWAAKFSQLKSSKTFALNEFEGMLILEARYLSFHIELNRNPESEMDWDKFQPEFARIIYLAEKVFQISGQAGPSSGQGLKTLASRAFSFSSSVMDAVFIVASFCRHHATRHKALYLLQNWSIKEGICDTKLASVIAEGFMGVEEGPGQRNCLNGGIPECECDGFYVCNDHRIQVVSGTLLDDGRMALMARTVGDVRDGAQGTFIPVSW